MLRWPPLVEIVQRPSFSFHAICEKVCRSLKPVPAAREIERIIDVAAKREADFCAGVGRGAIYRCDTAHLSGLIHGSRGARSNPTTSLRQRCRIHCSDNAVAVFRIVRRRKKHPMVSHGLGDRSWRHGRIEDTGVTRTCATTEASRGPRCYIHLLGTSNDAFGHFFEPLHLSAHCLLRKNTPDRILLPRV